MRDEGGGILGAHGKSLVLRMKRISKSLDIGVRENLFHNWSDDSIYQESNIPIWEHISSPPFHFISEIWSWHNCKVYTSETKRL